MASCTITSYGSQAAQANEEPPPESSLDLILTQHRPCPRCQSLNTKFCYYNNYSLTQPRHYCKNCRCYWTAGGTLRNVPVGGGCRKKKKHAGKQLHEAGQSTRDGEPAPAAAPGLSAGHGLPPAVRGGGPAAIATPGLSAGHGPPPAARSGGPAVVAAPGLSARHEPPPAARGGGPAAVVTPGLSAGHGPLPAASVGHGPLRVVRGCSPVAVAGPGLSAGQIDAF
ncbi:unnamed protein product [Sphagnum troendelagicum]|uniref:Dof-type domain-containing protein n=1 Tax=Sphagnum troendelagicum TaxID=128251 RepID=A0ABP0URS4_9BRYO